MFGTLPQVSRNPAESLSEARVWRSSRGKLGHLFREGLLHLVNVLTATREVIL